MTALDKVPANQNFLNPLNFEFQIKRAPNVNFFIQRVTIPSLSLAVIAQPTVFMPIPHSGKIEYGLFSITFKIDEDLQNYLELFDWMVDLGFPENFEQYQEISVKDPVTGESLTSDITLLVQDALRNPNFSITLQDAFPVALSNFDFGSTDTEVNYVSCTATFKYLVMKIDRYNHP